MVSVVVPIYKTEEYLPFCIESILKQTYEPVEIILVDDGSPDNAPAICDSYAEKYERVRVIHKENQGIGMARNSGLEAAQGAYVMFVDSDDALEDEHTVARMVACAEKKQADIVMGGFRRFDGETVSEVNRHCLREGDYTRTGAFRFRGFYQYGHLAYNWGKLYRREFLTEHGIMCRPYPFTQDKAMNMECYAYKPVYAFVKESVYRYRDNDESVTYKYKEDFMPVWISIATDFVELVDRQGIENTFEDLTDFHIFFGSFFMVKQELGQEHGLKRARLQLKKYGKHPFVRRAMRNLAKGTYSKEMPGFGWKLMVRGASILFCMHGYLLYALGIALLRKMEVDAKITKSRYQKGRGK